MPNCVFFPRNFGFFVDPTQPDPHPLTVTPTQAATPPNLRGASGLVGVDYYCDMPMLFVWYVIPAKGRGHKFSFVVNFSNMGYVFRWILNPQRINLRRWWRKTAGCEICSLAACIIGPVRCGPGIQQKR